MKNDGNKITKTKVVSESMEYLGKPEDSYDYVEEDECEEFTCVPIRDVVVQKNESLTCTEPKCPANYMIELDMSSAKPNDCPKYACVLKPKKDDVCEISGKTFTTFDGTEFKYDTCSHILARDLINSSWVVSGKESLALFAENYYEFFLWFFLSKSISSARMTHANSAAKLLPLRTSKNTLYSLSCPTCVSTLTASITRSRSLSIRPSAKLLLLSLSRATLS